MPLVLPGRRGGIGPGERVNLIRNYRPIPDKNGEDRNWVEIASPVSGFVSANSLMFCPGSAPQTTQTPQTTETSETPPPITESLCRQINPNIAARGAQVRADASIFSTYRGGIPAGAQVTLVPDYRLVRDKSGEGRNWVELASPISGFIAADLLRACPS